jgi:hypothetical protein
MQRAFALLVTLVVLVPAVAAGQVLASGQIEVEHWTQIGGTPRNRPNLYSEFELVHQIPAEVGPTAGLTLVVALRDTGRPEQTCPHSSPDSGCAVLDWSPIVELDDGTRQFDQTVTLDTSSGPRTFFLYSDLSLRPQRDSTVPI